MREHRTPHCDFRWKVERTSDFAELLVNKSAYTPPLSLPPHGMYVNNSRVLRGKKISKRAHIFPIVMKKTAKMRNLKLPASTRSCLTNPLLRLLRLLYSTLLSCFAYLLNLLSLKFFTCFTYFLLFVLLV